MQVKKTICGFCASVTVTLVLVLTGQASAANYPLQLISPRTAGTSSDVGGPNISSNHRIFWAYPGLEYNIRASVIGGAYPYTFALSNAPAGMTITSTTGTITWTNPTANATPTLTVTDSEGTQVTGTWTITVDATRFIFLDAVNGNDFDAPSNPGTGTLANPFKKIRDLYSGSVYASKSVNTHLNKIAIFRTGTYYIDGFIEDATPTYGGRMAVLDGYKPVAWVAYPGATPIINGQCRTWSPQIGARPCNIGAHIAFYGSGNNTYIDGFNIINVARHAFRVEGAGNYQSFRRNTFTTLGPTECCVNEGFITTIYSGSISSMGSYMTIQDNIFQDVDRGSCIKLYSTQRVLIEDNICRDGSDSTGGNDFEGIAIKGGGLSRVTVRHNTIYDIDQKGIGGNMNVLQSGEILFNRIYNTRTNAMDVNQDGVAGPIYIYRNTFVGQVMVRNTDSSDGPFYFQNNVIINNDPGNHLYYESVSDTSRILATNNLVGTPSQNIVGPTLNLNPAYSSYLGTHGYQLGSGVPAPRNLRVQ